MTIAAGMMHRDGLLLFADTELTYGDAKSQSVKNFRINCPYGVVGVVCAGNFFNAQSTIEAIAMEITKLPTGQHPLPTIRDVLDREYRRIVWDNPYHSTGQFDFQLILAIQPSGKKPILYATQQNTIHSSTQHECIGSGAALADQLISASPNLRYPNAAAILAAYVMGMTKRHVAGVGGMSLMMDFRSDGGLIEYTGDPYLSALEEYFAAFQADALTLALAMTEPTLSDETFGAVLETFGATLREHRGKMKERQEQFAATIQAYLQATRPPTAPPTLPATRRGRKPLPPSPESP